MNEVYAEFIPGLKPVRKMFQSQPQQQLTPL